MKTQRLESNAAYPDAQVAAIRMQGVRDAELLCRYLTLLGEHESFAHLRMPTKGVSLGLALGLAAAIRMEQWKEAGLLTQFEVQPPPADQVVTWLLLGETAGVEADRKGLVVFALYSALWSRHAAWDSASELGIDVLVDQVSELTDRELDMIADFFWKYRGAGRDRK